MTGARFLANGKDVPFKRDGGALTFDLPSEPPDPYGTVLVLDHADQSPRVKQGFAANTLPSRLDLRAWTARRRGEEIRNAEKTGAAAGTSHFIFEWTWMGIALSPVWK